MRADHQGENMGTRYLYIFVCSCGVTLMYRIEVVEHLRNLSMSTDKLLLHDLLPHVVFSRKSMPPFAVSIKLKSVFYFIGGDTYGNKDAKATDVYMMRESDISNVNFNENNIDGSKYLKKTTSMNSGKKRPLVFVADDKLYVLSGSGTDFEVFSPEMNSWNILPSKPSSHTVLSSLVLNRKVYFATNAVKQQPSVLCYDLEGQSWRVLTANSSENFSSFPQQTYPTFYSCVQIVENMVLGYIRNDRRIGGSLLSICASPLSDKGDFVNKGYMLPSLAPDENFLADLRSRAYSNMVEEEDMANTEHLIRITFGDKKMMCVISYGSAPVADEDTENYKWRSCDPFKSYLTLTFFEVNGVDESSKCFTAKSVRSTHYIIKSKALATDGEIVTCLY